MSPKNKDHYESEKEAIHLILTGNGDEIYSTLDACKTAHEIKFTSHDGETIESYYTRFYKLMNEMIRNNLTVDKMQVNVQFLQQRQPEWSRSHATTRHKGKEIAKPITPPSKSPSDEDSDPEQAQKDKEMYKNDNQTRQFGNQKAVNVAEARDTVGGQVKDSRYYKEKKLLCKQAEKGVQLQAEQSDWLADTDEEIDEQELEAHYSYMAKIQEVPNANSSTDFEPLEHNDQNVVEYDDERVALANLIANLKLYVDENKKIQKQLKKANASLTQELTYCLVALQNKQTELEKYMAFNDRTVDYDKLERKLNETLGLLAQKDIDIKEGLKLKAYKISVVQEKHDELVKQSLLTKSHYEGLVKEKTKVITDLKLKEEKDIDKMISMENQLKFLNEIVYKRSQSIQTIHMLAPKCPTFNGRPTFANPMYLKKAQNEKPCLYEIPHDQSDPANRLVPDREEMKKELVDQAWVKHSKDHFRAPTAQDMEILIKTCLMCLALKTHNDSFAFVHELKKEMHADLKYVESFENEIDELESDKAEFSNMYDMLLQECVSNDVMCSYLHLLSDLDAHTELQCLYLHKVKECDCLV
ncbi:hypothetical protein Tco_1393809 [Tanacetum coccineum]